MVNEAALAARAEAAAREPRGCVAIPTFRRPESLAALLRGIARQTRPPAGVIEVAVFDNDAAPTARAAVAAVAPGFPFRLEYVHVAEPGLASVRNAILAHARDRFDYLAMIDDDECPQMQWLVELLRVRVATGADVVVGPVPPLLPEDAPRWLRDGRFLELPTAPDAASIDFAYSGNCLLDVAAVERRAVVFDRALDFAGGEDLLFFRTLLARGARFAFAARAVAFETLGPERLRANYVLALNFRRGNTLAQCDRRVMPSFAGGARRAAKACGRIALGALTLLPLSLVRGRRGALDALCSIARGLGALCGLAGHTHQAYRRDHADAR